jgi:formate dehydrogenase (coenzyme F420) alpha subunit
VETQVAKQKTSADMKGDVSRRSFLRGSVAISAAAVGAPRCEEGEPVLLSDSYDFSSESGALEPDEVVKSACQFCNSLCRLHVKKKAGRIIEIAGETADPVQAGRLCVKAPMMAELVYNRHRIRTPLRRVGGEKGSRDSRFEPVSWEEALRDIARKLLEIRDTTGPQGVANKTSGRLVRGVGSIIGRFFELYGSPNATDVGPVCNDAGGNALEWTLGLPNFTNGYGVDGSTGREDLGAARFYLFLGTNQAETHPVTFEYLLRARKVTGARLVVVDPRRTPTASVADQHVAISPHTDMALVYGMIGHILRRKLYDRDFVSKWTLGFEELVAHVEQQGFSPEWAEHLTSVPARVIAALAEEFARSKPAAVFCNAGISHQLNSFHTYRALIFLAAITGNVGVPGGGCNFMHNTWPGGLSLPPLQGTAPSRPVELPVGPDWFATSVLEERPYPLRAIFMEGNPIVDSANSKRVREAYKRLELLVYPGLFMEEPAWFADYILPVPTVLEMDCIYMRRDDRAIRWANQALPVLGEARTDIHIWIDLAAEMAKQDTRNPPEYWLRNLPAEWKDYRFLWDEVFAKYTPGVGGMTTARMDARAEPLRWPCPSVAHAGVSTLYLDHPSWYQAAATLGHPGKRFLTPSGKVEIYTPALNERLRAAGHSALPPYYSHPEAHGSQPTLVYHQELVQNPINPAALTPAVTVGVAGVARPEGYPLVGMIGRPSVVHFATITQWTQTGKRLNGIRLVQISPKTARAAGIENGAAIRVESPRGTISATALVFDGMRDDTIFVPNLFGPDQIVGEELGLPLYEPANVLVDDRYFDNLSGQQAYKCFACRVYPAPTP